MGSKVIRNVTKILKATSGRLFGRVTSGTGRAEEITPADARTLLSVYSTAEVDAIIGGIEGLTSADIDTLAEINAILTDADLASVSYVDSGLSGKQATLVSGTNIKTVNSTSLLGSGDITVGVSGTGSVDNAVLRADGTGGATLQSSSIVIEDLFTASPNNTVNFVCIGPTGGTTNVGLALKPKGDGPLTCHVPDGTTTGGNARGSNAVDLQTIRSAATQVASGSRSVCVGNYSTASGLISVAMNGTAAGQGAIAICGTASSGGQCVGESSTASGTNATVVGKGSTASATDSIALGNSNTASGTRSFARGLLCTASGQSSEAAGLQSLANRYGMRAFAGGRFAADGDCQAVDFRVWNKTTNNTATTLFLNGSSTRLTIPSGKVLSVVCRICGIKSDGSAVANYVRRVVIKNVGGTTSLVGSVETIGTDIDDNASTDVAITADDTNDALQINVTGITSETWRWMAVVEGLEIAYGT